jgi:hypothetical protein
VFEEQRFGDDRSSTTGSAQAKDRCDDVNEQDDEIAYHRVIVINVCPMTRLEIPAELCDELEFAPHSLRDTYKMKHNLIFLLFSFLLPINSIQAQEWRHLFNGKDFSGWEQIGPGEFVIEDGVLKTVGGMGMLLFSGEKFSNVVIRVVFTVKDNNSNSGVFIRIPEKPLDPWEAVNKGYEIQIDNGMRHLHDDFHVTGVLYSLTKVLAFPQKRPGEWNTMDITLDGSKTVVFVNGKLVTEYKEGDPVPPKGRYFEPDRGPRPEAGYIGLQNHDPESTAYFREVAVKPLK